MKKKILASLILCSILLCSCADSKKSVINDVRYDISDSKGTTADRTDNVFPIIENAVIKDEIDVSTTEFDESIVYSLGDYKISSRMYYYIIYTQKRTRVTSSQENMYYGDDTREFWDSYYGMTDMTQKDYVMIKAVDDHCKSLLCCMKLFDEYGLKVSENVELTRQNLLKNYGSEENFNAAFASKGIRFDEYIEYFKYVDCYYTLYDYLYGEKGVKTQSDDALRKYFDENYVRFRHILFNFTRVGDDGYDELRDESEISERREKANNIYNRIMNKNNTFESCVYLSEDEEGATSGFLVTHGELIDTLDKAVFDLEIGEVTMVESRLGLHIIKKDVTDSNEFESNKESVMYAVYDKDFRELQQKYLTQITTDEKAKNMYDFYEIK